MEAKLVGSEVEVKYLEPATNSDGSSLTDLESTSIFTQVQGSDPSKVVDVAATSSRGGGNITQIITVPINENAEVNVDIWATAKDTTGNESVPSQKITIRIDRLSPSAPL